MFRCLFVISGALAILLALQFWVSHDVCPTSVGLVYCAITRGMLPGGVLVVLLLRRHNVLEYGAQRNLVYALPATFSALLYLAFVRRVGTWL